jgi:hypothetical protein
MKVRFSALLTALALLVVSPLYAQEEMGQLWDVQTVKVRPDHMDEFMGAVGKIYQAAEASDLSAEYGWHIWVDGFDVVIASPTPNMAAFDDPMAWMRQFEGTPGQEALNEAMEMMGDIAAQPVSREVWEVVDDWSYSPETPPFERPGHAELFEFWMKPGMQEDFQELAKEIAAFVGEHGAGYPMTGYRFQFGDVGRAAFIVFLDDWGAYYGPNAMDKKIAGTPAEEEWEAIMTRFRDCITDFEKTQIDYVPDLSYTGPES